MAGGEKSPGVQEYRRQRTPPPDLGLNRPVRSSRGLQRTSSLRSRGEDRRDLTPGLRRERTNDSMSSLGSDFIARNGTTFSSRCNKYIVHCGSRADDDNYLTPTQRSARDLRRLRGLLEKAYETIRSKDTELVRLKCQLARRRRCSGSPVDVAEPRRLVPEPGLPLEPGPEPGRPLGPDGGGPASPGWEGPERRPSVGDSASATSDCRSPASGASEPEPPAADPSTLLQLEARLGDDWEATEHWIECEEQRLRHEHELHVQQLTHQHAAEYQELKERCNDKVEGLLQQLTEANTRYFELRPQYDSVCLKLRQLQLGQPELAQPDEVTSAPLLQERPPSCWRALSSCRSPAPAGFPATAIDLWTATTLRLQQDVYRQQMAALEPAPGQQSVELEAPARLQFLRSAVYQLLAGGGHPRQHHLGAVCAALRLTERERQAVERAWTKLPGAPDRDGPGE